MSQTQTADKPEITVTLVKSLIIEQFPNWAHLPIKPVEFSGWDNRTFHLGKDMSIRLPSSQGYAAQVQKEHTWLSKLAPHLSFPIPVPLAMGRPSKDYPWNWSIYRWLDGESANTLVIVDKDLQLLASDLAKFLNELHKINVDGGPAAGSHNYWRGGDLLVYDAEAKAAMAQLEHVIDTKSTLSVWEKTLNSKWHKDPVWVHGDFASGNILIKDNKLAAIIDFGCMGIGDPACDLVIAWTFLTNDSRNIFKDYLRLDEDTWARARGWALWKACIELVKLKDKTSPEAMKHQQIISDILKEEVTLI